MSGGDSLARAMRLGKALEAAIARTAAAQEMLEKAQRAQAKIEREDLPELLRELKMKNFGMKNGAEIVIEEDFEYSVSEDRRPLIIKDVKDHGDGGLIKTSVGVEFGRNELTEAEKLAGKIKKLTDHPVIAEEFIHHSTLRAYIKEQRAKGKMSGKRAKLFGIHPITRAVYVPPKPKKEKA